jgi:fucose permease
MRRTFGRPLDHMGVLLLALMAGHLASSFASGAMVLRAGVGRVLLWSSVLVAGATAAFSAGRSWPVLVAAAVVSGVGTGAVDAGINTFAAARFAPRLVTWLHACWSFGSMVGPLLMAAAISAGLGWRRGYMAMAVLLAAMAVGFALTRRQWDATMPREAGGGPRPEARAPSSFLRALLNPRIRTSAVLFFIYAGLEATAGRWAYSLLTEARGFAPGPAGIAVGAYWGGLFVGRVAFGAAAAHVASSRLLRLSTASLPLAAAILCVPGGVAAAFAGLPLFGLLLAPVYPLLIAETPGRVGPDDAVHAVGFQIALGTLGVGLLPAATGVLASHVGLESLGPVLLAGTVALLVLHELASRPRAA